jgi:ABC-2 type transport system ATP-binding protein
MLTRNRSDHKPQPKMIEVRQLLKTYNETEALRSISFTVPAGQVCGYLGPNGAGKSTTVKILTGVLRPTSGAASVAGFDVVQESLEVKKRIGYVPETGTVYSTLSANEYLALVGALHEMEPKEIAERSMQMLELFQLKDAADRRLDTLSKGMRQKVVISAALLHDPEVVLFDEPLSGLDANAAWMIKDIVRGLADRGKTILYCSHILDVVERLCERVIILDRGEIVADGMTTELLSSSKRGTLETLFRSLTTTEDNKELVGAFLGSFATERASEEVLSQGDGKQTEKRKQGQ